MKVLFWTSFVIVFYTYIGYGMLICLLVQLKRLFYSKKNDATAFSLPPVSLVIAAFNEEEYIEQKLKNTFRIDYPAGLLEIIVITDGSTDATPDLVKQHDRIRLLHQPKRKGKVAAMNRAINYVSAPIVIFCDANTDLNAESIKAIVQHYNDPKVGAVAGEKVVTGKDGRAAGEGEGLYWKYESFLKKMDSEFYSTVGAAGELFSIRTELFEKAPEDTIIEDFVQSLKVCIKGYVVRYEPGAFAAEGPSESIAEEMKRKVRITAGAFQAMGMLKALFNIFRFPVLSFQFISHRILRWTLCPLCLVTLLFSNISLVFSTNGEFYQLFLIAQLVFYGMAITGWIFARKNIRLKFIYIPFYFAFMNAAVFLGFARFIRKRQSVLWEKAARQKVL
jgi:cellulose synthase/poly-beta-1,6-N-acetylglucosamine synthase-like glycosyltransferase